MWRPWKNGSILSTFEVFVGLFRKILDQHLKMGFDCLYILTIPSLVIVSSSITELCLKHLWRCVIPCVGNVTEEHSCVFNEISGMVTLVFIVCWKCNLVIHFADMLSIWNLCPRYFNNVVLNTWFVKISFNEVDPPLPRWCLVRPKIVGVLAIHVQHKQ
jgi:hypothetical protein